MAPVFIAWGSDEAPVQPVNVETHSNRMIHLVFQKTKRDSTLIQSLAECQARKLVVSTAAVGQRLRILAPLGVLPRG